MTKKQIPSAITLKKLRFAKLKNCIITVTKTSPQELEGQNKSHSNITLKMFLLSPFNQYHLYSTLQTSLSIVSHFFCAF